jgi:hypothetical protein
MMQKLLERLSPEGEGVLLILTLLEEEEERIRNRKGFLGREMNLGFAEVKRNMVLLHEGDDNGGRD